jgi:hypothetical protein
VLNPVPNVAVAETSALMLNARKVTRQGLEVEAKQWYPTLDTINISAHSIDIYKEFPTAFFNNYTTYHYGGFNLNAPKDVGSLFIPFCLYPGTYQPSGHINISRAREFYLKFTSDFFGSGSAPHGASTTAGLLVVIASAINILGILYTIINSLLNTVAVIVKAMASWIYHKNIQQRFQIAGNSRQVLDTKLIQ